MKKGTRKKPAETNITFCVFELAEQFYNLPQTCDPKLPDLLRAGMPADKDRYRVAVPGSTFDKKWRDLYVELYGPRVEELEPQTADPRHFVFCAKWKLDRGDHEEIVDVFDAIEIWLRRLRLRGCRPYIEELWNPSRNDFDSKTILETGEEETKQLEKLLDGRVLFTEVSSGRRKLLKNVSLDEFTTLTAFLMAQAIHTNNPEPTKYDLAAYYTVNPKTIYNYLRSHRTNLANVMGRARKMADSISVEELNSYRKASQHK